MTTNMNKELDALDFVRSGVSLDFAKLNEQIIKDLNKNNNTRYTKYKREDVVRFLLNPIKYSKELQMVSNYIYENSNHYKRLIKYYSNISRLDHLVESYGLDFSKSINAKSYRSAYQKTVDKVESMNIKHEFRKAMTSAWKLGTFYGYELFNNDSYFIMELPFQYCQISKIIDGCLTYSFDTSYFDKNPEQLDFYPKEFKSMYNSYKNGKKGKWQELDDSKTVCLKIGEEFYYDLPPFVGLFYDIFDLEEYKENRKISNTLANYKFLYNKIPMRTNSERNNDFLVDLGVAGKFHNKIANALPDEVSSFTTPFDVGVIEFKQDTKDKDVVSDAERDFYSASGTSQMLFNGSKSSQSNLSKSVIVDESLVFEVNRQIERIVTGKLKNEVKGNFKFRLRVLDNTEFNHKENTKMYLENAQYGLPVKTYLCASLGLTPSAITSMAFLENEILGLNDSFIPLQSTHTQSSDSETGGRPEKNDNELGDKGIQQRENEDNLNR